MNKEVRFESNVVSDSRGTIEGWRVIRSSYRPNMQTDQTRYAENDTLSSSPFSPPSGLELRTE